MAIEVSSLGWKGPHVAYACGQPLGRSMDPRQQHRLAAEAKKAAHAVVSMAPGGGAKENAQRRNGPSGNAVANATDIVAVWQKDARGNSESDAEGSRSDRKKKTAPKPKKATPALDAYRASQSREVPRYSGRSLSSLRREERQILQELAAIHNEQRERRKVPI